MEHDPLKGAPKIDGFEITRHIGRGGMGDVWEARQNVLGRKVAIKVLAKNLSRSEHFLARFMREAYTLGRLQHPGIVSIHDFRSTPDGMCCIIMEYVEGPKRGEPCTLYDLIVSKKLTPDRTRFIILQVLHALQYAHEEGVIHRDIKPTNVLIDRYGRVKVVDFGIAAMPADPTRKQLTYVGGPLGTAEYMAPEQTEDATKADHRADIYAVGVVIYEMLVGVRPKGMFGMPSKVRPAIDPAWDQIIEKALQHDRDQRFADAGEMIASIQTIRGGTISANPALPIGYSPPGETGPRDVVGGLPFDEEPEEFSTGTTPLPYNTPTAADDPDVVLVKTRDAKENDPSDTELLPEEGEPEIPSWMHKRRDQAGILDDTHPDLHADAASEPLFEGPAPGVMDSTMRLDKKDLESSPEPAAELPLAASEDLEDWLTAGPAPVGHDSSQMIEIAAHLAPTSDEVPSEPSPEEPQEAEKPTIDAPEAGEKEAPPLDLATAQKTLLPSADLEALPEGDFVELCLEAATTAPTEGDRAIPFRPALRPPTIKLFVLDDGSRLEGEWHRIREPRFVIGRTEGDLIIEYDRSMSSRHAEIAREEKGDGVYEFMIRDLGTTNGTFARASRATLDSEQEFLLGYRRYKLICDCQDNPQSAPYDKLIEVNKKGTGKAFRLGKPPVIIGRDPTQCNLLILDDPFLSPVHAVLKRDQRNRWVIKNYNSKNGIWIQIKEMKLSSGGEFQIGAQRFIVQMT